MNIVLKVKVLISINISFVFLVINSFGIEFVRIGVSIEFILF